MKLVTYQYKSEITIGAVNDEDQVVALTAVAPDMLTLIQMGPAGLSQAQKIIDQADHTVPLADVGLLAPIPQPLRNIMCLGKNYAEHAKESHAAWGDKHELPEFPIIFNKATTAINSPFGDIPYDTAVSSKIDFEAELAVIIGRQGKNITANEALDYVFGYTVMNDVSARDLQRRHKQFFKGKSLDGSAPLGPWIVTATAIPNPHNLQVTCTVNGVQKQNGNTNQMIFDIPETIRQLSLGMTLLPGDIIATGTPSGVGFARTPPEFLVPGDIVECHVEKIGTIRNKIG
ncbi:MAG: fumarylacetoacetate hydrolase family protein [Anaerolineales bacterium]|nr:fumarylacetoacetate hydrolase family protein [Anaerolineales bacterium]